MKIKNINIIQGLSELKKITDPYKRAKKASELAGLTAFYGHTVSNRFEDIQKVEKMAMESIYNFIKKYSL